MHKNDQCAAFTDLAYGMIIHWGLYAIPAGMWDGRIAPFGSEWIMKNLNVPLADYQKLVARFAPARFDARAIVRLAKRAGMKYLVFTAKHHDGFAMYDSKVSDYTIMHTPFGRDAVREFADACAAEEMPFGIYYSQYQDWEHPDGNGNTWDFPDEEKKDFRRYFYEKALPQVRELLTNYGKVFLLWFDTPYDMPKALCEELRAVVKACQPDCLINGRIGYGLCDYRQMADNSIPVLPLAEPWEVPMTLNSSWGYSRVDTTFISEKEILDRLVTVNGKGGNLLLNIAPDENGEVPEASVSVLENVGDWLRLNGESIFGAGLAPMTPYVLRFGSLTGGRDRKLYLHIRHFRKAPPYRVLLTGLETKVLSATLLSTGEELTFRQSYEPARDEHRLYVFLPPETGDALAPVVRLTLADAPSMQRIGAVPTL